MRRIQIGVIGPSKVNYPGDCAILDRYAEELGRLVAESGAILFVGGASGLMESCARGAKKAGGITVGTPGRTRMSSNKFIDIEVLTPIDVGDFVFAGILSCDVIIVLGESAGTTAELALAYRYEKKIIVVRGFSKYYDSFIGGYLDNKKAVEILGADDPREAVDLAVKLSKESLLKDNVLGGGDE